jgi:aromatic ring-opening dioxygenase LigB subunit
MPHPPIIVPAVGRGREKEAGATLTALETLLARLSALPGGGRPDHLLILSPHQCWVPGALFVNDAPALEGDLSRFGAGGTRFRLTSSEAWPNLAAHLRNSGVLMAESRKDNLTPDHGSQVPLYFLRQAFAPLPPVVMASPIGLSPDRALDLGRALAAFPSKDKWALLASGDLSHCLTPESPAGFSPEGATFDREVIAALKEGQAETLVRAWSPSRLERIGECGFRSALTLSGLAGGPVDVLSYEGPFGVGYGVALWTAAPVPSPDPSPPPAREASA